MFGIICDYLIFFGFLIGSTLFPLWGNLLRKKNSSNQSDTKANYVFATGQVGIFAMMLSIARGTLGVRAFLGKLLTIFYLSLTISTKQCGLAIFKCDSDIIMESFNRILSFS